MAKEFECMHMYILWNVPMVSLMFVYFSNSNSRGHYWESNTQFII